MSLARYLASLLNSSGQVEAAKLAATLDLSSKTLTYPDNSVQSADIASLAASKLSGQVPDANAPSGSVIQVVQTVKTDIFTTYSTSFVDVTGLSATITPLSATSKILVMVTLTGGGASNAYGQGNILRGSTVIAQGDSSGSRTSATFFVGSENTQSAASKMWCFGMNLLDSPNTTSATTYKIQVRSDSAAGRTLSINTPGDTATNLSYITRGVSSITLMEIAV